MKYGVILAAVVVAASGYVLGADAAKAAAAEPIAADAATVAVADPCGSPGRVQSVATYSEQHDHLWTSYFKGRRDFWDGRLVSRACQIESLRAGLLRSDLRYAEVAGRAFEISRLYAARSGRQQMWLDGQSTVTGIGGVGYLASAGAGAATQAYWGYAALAPLLFTQFNAYEPTRDLFYGAAQGIDAIALRYRIIDNGATYLATYSTAAAAAGAKRDRACAALNGQLNSIINTWTSNRPDKTTILPEAQRIAAACASAAQSNAELDAFTSAVTSAGVLRAYGFATDMISLDGNVVHRDQELRYTPFKTLTAIAAVPLQAASKLLTGEDGQKALEGLKTQAAFNNLDLDLQAIDLPPPPRSPADPVTVAGNVRARVDATVEDNAKDPKREAVQPAVSALVDASEALNQERTSLAFRINIANRIALAAASSHLSFKYDATNRAVAVTLAAPATTPPPISQTGAGAATKAVN
ncbi:MAG: hypothetical protein JWP49_2001 [Phenylobacterium sp.]|nr:hypothetical protein [Phenylobacterium sp.]